MIINWLARLDPTHKLEAWGIGGSYSVLRINVSTYEVQSTARLPAISALDSRILDTPQCGYAWFGLAVWGWLGEPDASTPGPGFSCVILTPYLI